MSLYAVSSIWCKTLLICVFSLILLAMNRPENKIPSTLELFRIQSAFDAKLYHAHQLPYSDFPCQPRKIHLSQANNVDEEDRISMTLSFALDYEKCLHAQPSIIYGRGLFPEGIISTTEMVQFDYASTTTGEMDYHSDWIHHGRLDNLVAGRQRYWYRVVVRQPSGVLESHNTIASHGVVFLRGAPLGETPVYSFSTPPLPHQPTSLALVGDLGQTKNSTKTMHHILQATQAWGNSGVPPVSALVIAGDLSYADGDPHRWERWLELMEPLLRTLPLQAADGNHEIECDNKTHMPFVPYENYFRNPNRIKDADVEPVADDYRKTLWNEQCTTSSEFLGHYNFGNAFYSFIHGLAHVIVLNSYTDTLPGSVQYNWLDQELQKVDRSETPWLLVMFHCPLHTTFVGHNGEINPKLMMLSMEPLFVQYQVNLIVSGHDHAFLRTRSMVHAELDPTGKGPIYLTLGAGGNREEHSKGYIHDEPEEWVAKRDDQEYGYGHLFLANQTHAHFNWARDGTTDEGIRDNVWLENQYYF